jgi:hypothetical protein
VTRAGPLLAAATLAACAHAPDGEEALMRHVEVLADPGLEGRAAGSDGEARAADYVAAELQRAGLAPRRQPVPLADGASVNVYALLPGTGAPDDGVVVVGAHLDHLGPGFPGAEDDASGVAVVLELARALAARRGELGRSVLFAFFGAEERGLLGSAAFVRAPPVPRARLAVMVNLDMIGRPLVDQPLLAAARPALGIDGARAVGLLGARRRPALRALVDEACATAGVVAVAPQDLPPAVDREVSRQSEGRGDSASFEAAGVPALFFSSGESSDYHRPSDTPDRLRPDVMARRARALAAVVLAASRAPRETLEAEPDGAGGSPHGWKIPVGLGAGRSIHLGAPDGAYVEGEASAVGFATRSFTWWGGYADVTHDFASGRTRASAGPEIGLGAFGVDGGYVVELGGPARQQGFVVRPLVSLAYLTITARVGHLYGPSPETFGEVGVLFKIPLVGGWSPARR